MKHPLQALSWQLLRAVLSIYFAITLVVTLTQMGVEYLHTRDTIRDELASVQRTFQPALATALWEINHEQLVAIRRGILDLPIITDVVVVAPGGRILAGASGDIPDGGLTHRFQVYYHFAAQDVHLADVIFRSDNVIVFDRLKLGYQMILLSALIKSTALTVLFVWAFRRRLGQPLHQLTLAVSTVNLDSLGRQHIDLGQTEENELKELERVFNRMLTKLDTERRNHDAALEALNKGLEEEVRKRTIALETANARLEELARTDMLTGVANRRYFIERAEAEMRRARRRGTPLALLMLDLDHFKRINDTWGHAAGDEVLRNFAHAVEATLRAGDLFARLGGEEFAILLPETDEAGATEAALRLLELTATQRPCFGGTQLNYTVSIGTAMLDSRTASLDALCERADTALYRAKQTGRARVVAGMAGDKAEVAATA